MIRRPTAGVASSLVHVSRSRAVGSFAVFSIPAYGPHRPSRLPPLDITPGRLPQLLTCLLCTATFIEGSGCAGDVRTCVLTLPGPESPIFQGESVRAVQAQSISGLRFVL